MSELFYLQQTIIDSVCTQSNMSTWIFSYIIGRVVPRKAEFQKAEFQKAEWPNSKRPNSSKGQMVQKAVWVNDGNSTK